MNILMLPVKVILAELVIMLTALACLEAGAQLVVFTVHAFTHHGWATSGPGATPFKTALMSLAVIAALTAPLVLAGWAAVKMLRRRAAMAQAARYLAR